MITWSEIDKLKAKNLKENGFTNKEIALKLKRSESSISHLFQREGIKLSLKERVNRRIKSVKKQRIEQVNQITKNLKYDEIFGYIIGVLYGDGSLRIEKKRGYIKLMAKNKSFVHSFGDCLERCFKKKPKYHEYDFKSTGKVYDITLYNKYLAKWLNDELGSFNERDWFIDARSFLNFGIPFCKGVIRGLFDSEGCVNHKGISIVSCNKKGLYSLAVLISAFGTLCKGFGLEPKVFKKSGKFKWELRINKKQTKLFAELIGSSIDYKKEKFKKYKKMTYIKGGWSHIEEKVMNDLAWIPMNTIHPNTKWSKSKK